MRSLVVGGLSVLLLLLTGLASAQVARSPLLSVPAKQSPRPQPCGAQSAMWERAHRPPLWRACRILARGYSLLGSKPEQSLALKIPKGSGLERDFARLRARALLRLGKVTLAMAAFDEAGDQRPAELNVRLLHEYALAATLAGRRELAFEAYSLLVPRASASVVSTSRIRRIRVEAALAALRLGSGPTSDGRTEVERLSAAVGYLTDARGGGGLVEGKDYVAAVLALVQLRLGLEAASSVDEVEVIARLRGRVVSAAEEVRVEPEGSRPRFFSYEYWALVAGMTTEPEERRDAWRRYLAQAPVDDPWRAFTNRVRSDKQRGR